MTNYYNIVLYLSTTLCIAQQNLSNGVNVVCDGVRVSGGHLCEAEAPTEAAAPRHRPTIDFQFVTGICNQRNIHHLNLLLILIVL